MAAKIRPRDDEGDRRQTQGEGGGDAERVVDSSSPDVAVGGGEEAADTVDTAQRLVAGDSLRHLVFLGGMAVI